MKFQLVKRNRNTHKIYKLICDKINTSIFAIFGFKFFNQLILDKYLHIYCIQKKKKILSVITVIEYKNYILLGKKFFFFILRNPLLFFLNFNIIIKNINKNLNFKLNEKYLHLLHLIIFKKEFYHITLADKDKLINNIFSDILKKHKSSILFLCLEKNNLVAKKFYLRNRFKFFFKNKNLIYLKKKYSVK